MKFDNFSQLAIAKLRGPPSTFVCVLQTDKQLFSDIPRSNQELPSWGNWKISHRHDIAGLKSFNRLEIR